MAIPALSRNILQSTRRFRAYIESVELQASCISLAREIDAAVGRDEVPENVQELASILNNLCHRRCDDHQTRAVIMMLLISVKSACQLGWFPQREAHELLAIIDLMWKNFSSPENGTLSVNNPITLIPQVMERFYPSVKLGHILLSFEAKPESKVLLKDFHISKKMPHSPKERVGLFVVRTEDISKSNCIIHPQEVSFLLNGKGVENRVNISMDSGPQRPTNVTALLNAGTNVLQAIGCFGGSYFVVIAFMDTTPLPDKPLLKDYVYSGVIDSNSDGDIVEGASRISLSCPISRSRIKLPVKGHVCKHLQCFDYWNYVNINTRIPSWRCPHCNQSVCYTDIRVDQNMIKILESVGHTAKYVVISADGSWMVVTENDENVELVPETTQDHVDLNSFLNSGPTVLDLTGDDDEMETAGSNQANEQKPCLAETQGPSNVTHKPATDYTMLNQSSASINTLPQLPQTWNAFDGQQFVNLPQVANSRDSAARQASPMTFVPTPSPQPQDRLATNAANFHTSIPAAQSSQFQGSNVTSLGHCLGRTSDLRERWNHIYGSSMYQSHLPPIPPSQHHYAMQNERLSTRSMSPVHQRPMPSSVSHPQTLHVNYGGNADQRPHLQTLPVHYGRNTDQRQMPSTVSHPQTLHVNYGGNTHERPMPSSITHPQTLPVNYGRNTDQRQVPSSITHLQTLPANYRTTADQRPAPSSITHRQNLPVNYGGNADQTPMYRPMPSSNTHLQTLPANYRGTADQRPMQIPNPGGGTMGRFSSRELMNLTSASTANWQPQSRMRGSLEPGSTGYEHMIIQPTQPVQAQAQTLPPPQSTTNNNAADQIREFLVHPSYPIGRNETQGGSSGSLPVTEGLGSSGSFWSMPPETW
ncbi:E4 SUMO-protein ligase PIAL1 [Cardamine amara subsp. amara]|uniref:E4 SUMO-protein ligase PIAL1 n=1 Tax=Cardamine amara subsp. amara TaxID=228776 RepID=A0ABD1ACZ1_CARAN